MKKSFKGTTLPKILPGLGLDTIYFGMSEKEVSLLIGPPEERIEFEEGDVHFNYDSEGISFFFRADERGFLAGMEVDSRCNCTIWDVTPWDLNRRQLLLFLTTLDSSSGLKPLTSIGGHGEVSVRVDELFLEFFFGDSGLVESINWSVVVDDSDKTLWPSTEKN